MKFLLMAVILFATGCTPDPGLHRPVVGRPPVTIAIIPELYPGQPNAIRVILAGEQQVTRPVTSVLASMLVQGPQGTIPVSPSNMPAELTYRGSEDESYLLPSELIEGKYWVTVVLDDWGIAVAPASAEITQLGHSFQMEFTYPQP